MHTTRKIKIIGLLLVVVPMVAVVIVAVLDVIGGR